MTPSAVFFDVGETLVDEERYWRAAARAADLGPHVLWAALGKTIERGEEHWALWGHLGIERPTAWDELVYSTDDLYPDALDCLERMRSCGMVVGVAGNQSAALEAWARSAGLPVDVVLVHDAARPLVDDALIERVLARLDGTVDGVVPGVGVQDTVKRVSSGVVVETVDREGLVVVQTPQAFVADTLRAAFTGDLAGATDCASLVERRGGRVAVVDGDPRLAKVTTIADLERVAGFLDSEAPHP